MRSTLTRKPKWGTWYTQLQHVLVQETGKVLSQQKFTENITSNSLKSDSSVYLLNIQQLRNKYKLLNLKDKELGKKLINFQH